MIFGVRAHDYGMDTPARLFSRIEKDGWKTVQFAPRKALQEIGSLEDLTLAKQAEIQQALAENGLTVAVLGAYVEPSLADEKLRQASVKEFIGNLSIAKALGAGCIGTETTAMEKQPGISREDALKQLERSLEEILPEAQQLGVTVAVEPVFYHAMATPEDTKQILSHMRSPWLKVIFDPVNLFAPQEVGKQHALWERAFDCFGTEIVAVHMKGIRVENEQLRKASFVDSQMDYPFLFERLRTLGEHLPVLREEAVPMQSNKDLAFLTSLAE